MSPPRRSEIIKYYSRALLRFVCLILSHPPKTTTTIKGSDTDDCVEQLTRPNQTADIGLPYHRLQCWSVVGNWAREWVYNYGISYNRTGPTKYYYTLSYVQGGSTGILSSTVLQHRSRSGCLGVGLGRSLVFLEWKRYGDKGVRQSVVMQFSDFSL